METLYTTYIAKAPLYYVRSGYINLGVGHLAGIGIAGYPLSNKADTRVTDAYTVYFTASVLYPSSTNARFAGFPLRCLAD